MDVKLLFDEIESEITDLRDAFDKTTTFNGGRTLLPRKDFNVMVQGLLNKISSITKIAKEKRSESTGDI